MGIVIMFLQIGDLRKTIATKMRLCERPTVTVEESDPHQNQVLLEIHQTNGMTLLCER